MDALEMLAKQSLIENLIKYIEAQSKNIELNTQAAVLSAALVALKAVDDLAKLLTLPILSCMHLMKKITSELNNAVDMNATWAMVLKNLMMEVGDLSAMGKETLDLMKQMFENFLKPEDSPIVQDVAAKIVNGVINPGFRSIVSPLKKIESFVPELEVTLPIKAVSKALDGVVLIATTNISSKDLDQMLSMKVNTDADLKNAANKMKEDAKGFCNDFKEGYEKTKNGVKDKFGELSDKAKDVTKNVQESSKAIARGLGKGAKLAWKNFRTPELPPGIKLTIDDFMEAVTLACANIDKLVIVLILKMIALIFKLLKKILKKLGLGCCIPKPLKLILELLPDIIAIFMFIMNFPASLSILVKAIIKCKIKLIAIMLDPPCAIKPLKKKKELPEKNCGGGGGGGKAPGPRDEKFTVKFYDAEDKVISTLNVNKDNPAKAPANPKKPGYVFEKWDQDFSSVLNSMDIRPIFGNSNQNEVVVDSSLITGSEMEDRLGVASDAIIKALAEFAKSPNDPNSDSDGSSNASTTKIVDDMGNTLGLAMDASSMLGTAGMIGTTGKKLADLLKELDEYELSSDDDDDDGDDNGSLSGESDDESLSGLLNELSSTGLFEIDLGKKKYQV